MELTKLNVIEALRNVISFHDSDNIIDLGMVGNIEIQENSISFDLVLSKNNEKAREILINAATKTLREIFGNNLDVQITPVLEASKGAPSLNEVKHIIAIASGKGGVGKSTVAANLAIALSRAGKKVGLVDADIYGPSVPTMFDLVETKPEVFEQGGKPIIIPIEKYGVKVLSIGFFVTPEQPLIWRGPMATGALNQLLGDGLWGKLDYLIVDLPPGTGDIQLTLAQVYKISGAVIVTTPQKVALADVKRAASMFKTKELEIPLLGVIENMAYFTPEDMPEKKYYIFGTGYGEQFAKELSIPLIGKIPMVEAVAASGDKGSPIALDEKSPVTQAFDKIAEAVIKKF
ncbi:MAG: Mrp/NBP35 family ATP-binding protein [Lentimicrobiaceae bacterium]|nr:Mrp/NBP35 family ATP-binding protein [Lentimicrobiaceae bacterium]